MSNKPTLQYPGQIELEDVSIISYNKMVLDLRPYLLSLEIRESMIDLFVQGSLTLADSLNLARHLPIIGNEIVQITFSTPTRTRISFKFNVGRISRRVGDEKSINYNLELISCNMFNDLQHKFSKSYFSTIDDIIYDICQTYYDKSYKFNIWKTNVKKNFALPYLQPSTCITQLSEKSYDMFGNTNFVFFEGIDNSYNFRPFFDATKLPVRKYSQFQPSAPGSFLANSEIEYSRIREIEIYESSDAVKNITNGVFSSGSTFIDSFDKSYKVLNYSYNKDFYNYYHINKYGILPVFNESLCSKYDSYAKTVPNTSYSYDNSQYNDRLQDFVQRRQSSINSFDSFKVAINTFGDTNTRLGANVYLNIQTNAPTNLPTEEMNDQYISGIYCISRITHNITRDSYNTDLLLVKDSMAARYPDGKIT